MSYFKNKVFIHTLLIIFINQVHSLISPTWITSQKFQAGTLRVIDGDACNCQVNGNQITKPFLTSFSTTPMIVVGASSIDVNNFNGKMDFQVSIASISATSVKVNVDMREDLWTVQTRFLAIDQLFPYHINCFKHVHVDVDDNLVNVTVARSYQTTYTNMVNYTKLANSEGYNTKNTFTGALTNYKTAIYLGCFVSESTSSTAIISFTLQATPVDSQTIKFYVTAGIQFKVTKLHMGLVVMDVVGVYSSNNYILIYGKLQLNQTGGNYKFIQQSQTTFMYGLTDFDSPNRNSYMSFFTKFDTISGDHQVLMEPSSPRQSKPPISRFGLNYFYLKQYICPSAHFFNKTIEMCEQCTVGCLNCTSLTSCTLCDNTNSYFLNSSSGTCKICSDSIPGCLTCSSLTTCVACDFSNAYYLSTGICQLCLASQNKFINMTTLACQTCSLTNCNKCSSLTQCSQCSLNYFLNSTDYLCYPCNLVGCIICSSLTICQTCNISSNYIKLPNNTCQLCISNTFANSLTNFCDLCPISNCISCLTVSVCAVCDTSSYYYLSSGTCNYCDPTFNQFIDPSGNCQVCYPVNCIACLSLTECSVCLAGYYKKISDSLCYPCPTGCAECSSLTICTSCIPNYILNTTTKICDVCTPITCPTQEICGDFIHSARQQCDDGNLDSGDGCSSFCQIQTDFICQSSIFNPLGSACFFVGIIRIEVVYIDKIESQNKILVLLEYFPKGLKFWNDVDFTKVVQVQSLIPIKGTQVIKNGNGTVSLLFQYEKNIQGGVINIQVNMTNSGIQALQRTQVINSQLVINPTQNSAAYFYDSFVYNLSHIISIICSAISGLSLIFFIIGLICGKMIGVDMMSVVQISFFSLMAMVSLNPTFAALSSLKLANGYNSLGGNHLEDQITPTQVKGLYFFSRFTENFNFTTAIIIFPLLVSFISFVLSKTVLKNNQKVRKVFKKSLGQYTLNGLLFSGYIISVSLILHLKYGSKKNMDLIGILSLTECGILTILIVIYILFLTFRPKYFGEFTEQLQQDRLSSKYYVFSLIERLVVGMSLVLLLQINVEVIVPIVIFLLGLVYILVRKPFKKRYNNMRVIFNMLIAIIINSIYLAYRITPEQKTYENKIFLFLPLVVVLLLIICIVYNAVLIIYTIYSSFKAEEEKNQYQDSFKQFVIGNPQKFICRALPESDRIQFDLIRKDTAKQVMGNMIRIKKQEKKEQMPVQFIKNELAQGKYDEI